jgi:hypothetical protein
VKIFNQIDIKAGNTYQEANQIDIKAGNTYQEADKVTSN